MSQIIEASQIEKYLAKKENLEIVEQMLDSTSQTYLSLKKQAKKLDRGPFLTWQNLPSLLSEVRNQTEQFLGVKNISSPDITIFNLKRFIRRGAIIGLGTTDLFIAQSFIEGPQAPQFFKALFTGAFFGGGIVLEGFRRYMNSEYNPSANLITVAERRTVPAVAAIAHEYTHHIQGIKTPKLLVVGNPLTEGFAGGVARAISSAFTEQYSNPAYIYDELAITSSSLKDTYLDLCRKFSLSPSKSLQKLPIAKKSFAISGWTIHDPFIGHYYCLGNTLMIVAEAKHSTSVYQDIIKGNLGFLSAA